MERNQDIQQQQQQLDQLNDPSTVLAVAMIKAFSVILDCPQLSIQAGFEKQLGDDQEEGQTEAIKQAENQAQAYQPPAEIIELSPVQDLCEKLSTKKLLTKEELNVIQMSASTQFNEIKNFAGNEVRIREFLTMGYYSILNTQSYSHGLNYLGILRKAQPFNIEFSAHIKLTQELINLVKKILDILAKKDQDPHLYNNTLPIILKMISVFQSKETYDQAFYRYLRSASLKVVPNHLSFLNQYLIDLAPEMYGLKQKKSQIKQEDQINLPQNFQLTENDSLDKILEFLPPDYQSLSQQVDNSLQNTNLVNQVKDEEMVSSQKDDLNDQEEEKSQQSKQPIDIFKEQIKSSKILESLQKAVDQYSQIAETVEGLQMIDTEMFSKINSYSEKLNLKLKHYPTFITKTIFDRILQSQRAVENHILESSKSHMEVDQEAASQEQINTSTKQDSQLLQEHFLVLSKNLEIISKTIQLSNASKISNFLEELIREGKNFTYILKLLKQGHKVSKEFYQPILMICTTVINYMTSKIKQQEPLGNQLLERMEIVANLLKIVKLIEQDSSSFYKKEKPASTRKAQSDKQMSVTDQKSTGEGIRTRGQLKKEKETSSVTKESSQAKKKAAKDQQKAITGQIQYNKTLDPKDVLKQCLSLFVIITNKYLSQQEVALSPKLIKRLFDVSYKPSEFIHRQIVGIASEFTKPSIKYTYESRKIIDECLFLHLDSILDSHTQTLITIRFLLLTKNQDLYSRLLLEILTKDWRGRFTYIREFKTIYQPQNLNKLLLLLTILLMMDQENKKNFVGCLLSQQHEERFLLNMLILMLSIVNQGALKKTQPIIYDFISKMFKDNEPQDKVQQILNTLEKTLNDIILSGDQIFDTDSLQQFRDQLSLPTMIDNLKRTFLHNQRSDQKAFVLPLLKLIVRLNQQLGTENNIQDRFQELSSQLSQTLQQSDQTLIISQFERSSNKQTQAIQQKIQSKTDLSQDDVNIIHAQVNAIKMVSQQVQVEAVAILSKFIVGGNHEFARVILEYSKLSNVNIKSKINQQLITITPDDNKFASILIDPYQLIKLVSPLITNDQEENIYSHTLLYSNQDYQHLVSLLVLQRSIFNDLYSIVNTYSMESQKEMLKEVALYLLQIKYHNPCLELLESNGSYDNDLSDKILQKSFANNLTNRDFMKIRLLDSSVHCITQSLHYLRQIKDSIEQVHKDQRKLLIALSNEISANLTISSLKGNDEIKILNDYINGNGGLNCNFFRESMKSNKDSNIASLLWEASLLFIDYCFMDVEDTVEINEKKGGIQMIISLGDKKPPRKGLGKRSTNRQEPLTSSQQNQEQVSPQKKQPQISQVSQKLLNMIIDLLSDKNQNAQEEQKQISEYVRGGFLNQGQNLDGFFLKLSSLGQGSLLKRIIQSLLSKNNNQQKNQIQEKIYTQILTILQNSNQNSNNKDQNIIDALELIQIITDNNKQILQFITQQVLPQCNEMSQIKLQILDYLCQLGQQRFSKVENEQLKYSSQQIIETRKKTQEDKQNEKIKRNLEASQAIEEVKEESKESKSPDNQAIEGYKQEKFIKESDYQRFMEKPEDVCTFTQTKKDFKYQHWYFCYTCNLTGSNGCCAVCARKCHAGHQVVYSKKSNFFCDCGDSGKCKSLSQNVDPNQRPQTGKRRTREEAHLQEKGLVFQNTGNESVSSIFGIPPSSRLFQQPPSFINPGEDDEAALIFKQLGNYYDQPPPNFMKYSKLSRDGQLQFMSESSEEDNDYELKEEFQDDEDLQDEIIHPFKHNLKIMHLINRGRGRGGIPKMPREVNNERIDKLELAQSSSNISHINPIEDPLSEISTPIKNQGLNTDRKDFANFTQFSQQDYEMEQVDEIQLATELIDLIKQERGHFEEVFNFLIEIIDTQINSQIVDADEEMSVFSSPRKKENSKSFSSSKANVTLVSDLTSLKKSMKEGSFNFKLNEISKKVSQYDLNLVSMIDSNKDGLVAVCEDQEVVLYAGSQFFEDQSVSNIFEQFNYQVKDGQQLFKIESQQFTFTPISVRFNPSQPYFLAVIGAQNLEILTISSQGKIVQRLRVDLLLEMISQNLTLINAQWLPGSQVMIAVATNQFVKIYDLSEDIFSPTHNLMIFGDDLLTDFTFSKMQILSSNSQRGKSTIYISAKSGNVYAQEITYKLSIGKTISKNEDQVMNYEDNSQIMVTRILNMDPTLLIPKDKPSLSVYYSNLSDLLFITYQGGFTYAGKVECEDQFSGFNINVSEDPSYQGSHFKNVWAKHGENLVQFKDLGIISAQKGSSDNKVYLVAQSRKQGAVQFGIPVLLEISENQVEVNIMKQSSGSNISPSAGLAYVKSSLRNNNNMRIVSVNSDGSIGSFSCNKLNTGRDGQQETISKFLAQDKLISKADLPKEVKLSINFFERMKNIYSDPILKPKFTILGDITNYFKSSKASQIFDHLSKVSTNQPIIVENSKKQLKMILKLDQVTDHLITGFRIKVDINKQGLFQLKVFNRVHKLKTNQQIWFDIPFCDSEIMFGTFNNVEIELFTDDVKACPIKIFAIEVFAISKKDFGFKEKIKKLEKLNEGLEKKDQLLEINPSKDEQIRKELMKTKGVTLVTWQEKMNFLRDQCNAKEYQLIESLDIISQYIGINQQIDQAGFSNLIQKLSILFKQALLSHEKNSFVLPAIKRCLRKILTITNPQAALGDPQNYHTIKDQIIIQVINQRIDSADLTISEIRAFIQNLSSIYSKRHYHLFKIIEAYPDIIVKIANLYLQHYKNKDSETAQDVSSILSLITANYHENVNKTLLIQDGEPISKIIMDVYNNQSFAQYFQVLQPYLLNSDEFIQKIVISSLISQLGQHSKTMATILRLNQTPSVIYNENGKQNKINVLLLDFSPHLIFYLFNLIQGLKEQADVCFSLVYKIIKLFEKNCSKSYKQYYDYSSQLTNLIGQFISSGLTQVAIGQNLYDQSSQFESQYIYLQLILSNMFLQQSCQGNDFKLKKSNLSLENEIREGIIKTFIGQKNVCMQYTEQIISILANFDKGFKEGKCSFRIKIEEGIPTKVYEQTEAQGNSNGQQALLRPMLELAPWKWHPIFVNADKIFDQLDRKIPAQIMLNIQYLVSYFELPNDLQNTLIQQVKEISFKNPSKIFLKELGEQSLKSLLIKAQQANKFEQADDQLQEKVTTQIKSSIKGYVAFQEFFDTFEGIYVKFIKRKVAMNYNMQFQLHSLLQKVWKKANTSNNWQSYILEQKNKILNMLFESGFLLNEESSQLCLALCGLAFEVDINSPCSIVKSFKVLQNDGSIDLFKLFNYQNASDFPSDKIIDTQGFELKRLINILLLGKNKRIIRVTAAHILKGIYEMERSKNNQGTLFNMMLSKLNSLKTYGINSQEFIAILSYMMNRQLQLNDVTNNKQQEIALDIFNEILNNNNQLSAHPNLEIYSTLQRISPVFNGCISQEEAADAGWGKKLDIAKENLIFLNKHPFSDALSIAQGGGKNKKITNPYFLENEVCQKCYDQKSLPYSVFRLNDIKSECKFTDSTLIIKFITTYLLKNITINLDNVKGTKVIKTVNIYINNKQGVDLADMKNNWNYWKKVKTVDVEIGQRQIPIEFTLPINATNLLVEYQTVNLSKPLTGKERAPPASQKEEKIESIHQVTGLDTVLMTLPKNIASKIGSIINQKSLDVEIANVGNGFDKEMMNCPRCGKQVQGKHGICNSCGENALQCTFCRNINYEKPDGFLCNECGFSRFVKIDTQFTVKQGFASEKIESEEAKNQALQSIESQLQTAQTNYSHLMKKRQQIQGLIKKINEGSDQANAKLLLEIYGDECSEIYQKMMKCLNTIKILKIEINQFTQAIFSSEDDNLDQELKLHRSQSSSRSNEEKCQNCFSCIQEYLKALLGLLQQTSDQMAVQYKKQGFLELLYNSNLKMYSQSLQDPARNAICSILKKDQEETVTLMTQIEKDLLVKSITLPAHLISQNITQESQLVIDLVESQQQLRLQNQPNFFKETLNKYWTILFQAIKKGSIYAPIADQVLYTFIAYLKDLIKEKSNQEPQNPIQQELLDNIYNIFEEKIDLKKCDDYFTQGYKEQLNYSNFLVHSLIIGSSLRVREEAKEILTLLSVNNQSLSIKILKSLVSLLDEVLLLNSNGGDQYFDLIAQILNPSLIKEKITEQSLKPESDTFIFVQIFEKLFQKIDGELEKLVSQENDRMALGNDGFMPQISTGQILSKLVNLVSQMIKESTILKSIIQDNVNLVIKSFLKIRKLNLTKNKLVQNSEIEIEKMFRELHSEKEDDKSSFILECIKIIESGECDIQEIRFLFEEICKVIDPVKPDPEYFLNLNKAPSQEFYFRGKMSKNPYSSIQLGKTMADVRAKICKEMEVHEPELLELLVAGKIIGVDLPIRQVYEQVFWPALCKQRNPDIYDIPSIEDQPKSSLQAMSVTFRLMGIDGEATEDRVETLADGSEQDQNPSNIEKKYGVTQVLCQEFESKYNSSIKVTGMKVLLDVLQNFGQLAKQRYLAEWLLKLMGFAIKIKSNRISLMKTQYAVDMLAKRLFESVGMQSQIEGQKGATLFDVILNILESIVGEVSSLDSPTQSEQLTSTLEMMEIDQQQENLEAATHVEIFIQIMADACNEMQNNHQQLDKTSKKIKAISKILPFLINGEDKQAIQVIASFIVESVLLIANLDQNTNSQWTAKKKFSAQFNIERVIDILESTTLQKNFLKNAIFELDNSSTLDNVFNYVSSVSLIEPQNEQTCNKYKLSNQYSLKFINAFVKNHPQSQQLLQKYNLLDKFYQLSQAKFKDRLLIILAQDIVQNITNKNHLNDQSVQEYLQKMIDQQNDEKKKLAQKKKEEIMRQMAMKKTQNKFIKQVESVNLQEEEGPKCIVCQEGYSKKPTEVLGMYVFTKKVKISEITQSGVGFTTTHGYTTVTHSNYIHFICHQNAYRADSQLKQPKKEWEGAAIRNDHTKCNNLFPLRGGSLPEDSFAQMVDRYFQVLIKSVGQCDHDRVNVMLHDLKMVIKRLAYEDSFSRDTHGGGPEHNMHLIPFMIQIIHYLLQIQHGFSSSFESISDKYSYTQEKRLYEFLEEGLKQKKDFMSKLEEEKKADEIEEEEKFSEDMSQSPANLEDEEDEGDDNGQMNNFHLDQIALNLTKCIVFTQMPKWEQIKQNMLSIILCTVAGIRDNDKADAQQSKPVGPQTDYATGKKVITISRAEDVQMAESTTDVQMSKRRRLSSDNKIDLIQKALVRVRPLLVMMRIVDTIKQRWDGKRLSILDQNQTLKQDAYLAKLINDFLAKGNLNEVITDCDEIFREYKDRVLKIGSVEEFLQDLGMLEKVISEHGSVEQYVMSHF